jgi:hypothetical protein
MKIQTSEAAFDPNTSSCHYEALSGKTKPLWDFRFHCLSNLAHSGLKYPEYPEIARNAGSSSLSRTYITPASSYH